MKTSMFLSSLIASELLISIKDFSFRCQWLKPVIPVAWEAETPSQWEKSWAWWHTPVIPAIMESLK
jgi:hypothetical protein